ncbi:MULTISPECIES: TetR family transcriptional regulator [Rhodococcus]|uniref:TetR family transcriptional regulator n=2 Tax=Rhodococcus TaxID=1827 RepID=A0ABU4BZ02_RHOGO|nr:MULTISPECIES: helix-turn-helix domain-containing protein [Rhodococcus]MDV6269470.1 TetR family transcriptional regulator [Rhodococcus globerulus]RZL25447.1 MAG: TetR family transcriptional regulator [Rhodococcus sp. (in: high G+C Gram-positive bacteria)]
MVQAGRIVGDGLGARMRAARIERKVGLRQLAQQIGMSASSLSEFENGKSLPGAERLEALAKALGVELDLRPPEPTGPRFEDWRDFERLDLTPVFRAALDVFVEVGYHAATVRMIADRCGLSMAGVYYHVESKDALLTELLQGAMAELISRCVAADAEAESPDQRVANLVECVILFHTHRQASAVLASTELRSLDEPGRLMHLQLRRQVREIVQSAVEACRDAGRAGTVPATSTATAIVTMCVAVADWYQPGISPSPVEIAREYADLALAMVDARSTGAR